MKIRKLLDEGSEREESTGITAQCGAAAAQRSPNQQLNIYDRVNSAMKGRVLLDACSLGNVISVKC